MIPSCWASSHSSHEQAIEIVAPEAPDASRYDPKPHCGEAGQEEPTMRSWSLLSIFSTDTTSDAKAINAVGTTDSGVSESSEQAPLSDSFDKASLIKENFEIRAEFEELLAERQRADEEHREEVEALRNDLNNLRARIRVMTDVSPAQSPRMMKPNQATQIIPSIPGFLAKQLAHVDAQNRWTRERVLATMVLFAVPFLFASQGICMKMGIEFGTDFFDLTPVIFGSLAVLLGELGFYIFMFGREGLELLVQKKYLLPGVVAGGLTGACYACRVLSFVRLAPSLAFVISKTSIIWSLLMESVHQKAPPSSMQLALVMAVMLACVAYSLMAVSEMEEVSSSVLIAGVSYAAAAAFCSAASGMASFIGKTMLQGDLEAGADARAMMLRWLMVLEFFKIIAISILFVGMEGPEAMERGVFAGWSFTLAGLLIPPFALTFLCANFANAVFGPTTFGVVLSLDVSLSYFAEVGLGFIEAVPGNVCMVVLIPSILVAYSYRVPEAKKYYRQQLDDLLARCSEEAVAHGNSCTQRPSLEELVRHSLAHVDDDGADFD